jgi:hypothetical protein
MRKIVSAILVIATSMGATYFVGDAQAKNAREPYVWPEVGVETRLYVGSNILGARGHNSLIRNFEPDGDRGVWIEDHKRRWYYAEILGTCTELNFAQAIGFENRGSAYFDKFTRIFVRGDSCAIASFVTAAAPLPRKERNRIAKEARAAEKAAKAAR